jgi:two-component system, LuxR family, response regulator FixJ
MSQCAMLRILKNQAQDAKFQVPPMAAEPRNPMGGAPVVVIVDDDPAVCGSLKFSLELEGFEVRAYGDAGEFLAADESTCDCLVIDQRMPGMSGMELITRLRALEVRTPAILLISQPNPAIAARAAKAAVPIVEKPLFGNALLEQIREACGRGRN